MLSFNPLVNFFYFKLSNIVIQLKNVPSSQKRIQNIIIRAINMKKLFLTQVFMFLFVITGSVSASNRATPVSEAVKLIQNSVVNIRTEQIVNKSYNSFNDPFMDDFFGYSSGPRKTQSIGSGVILSSDGIIVTNNHVVEAANKIFVMLPDNRQLEAQIIGTDPTIDLAVIKIKGTISNLIPARIGTSSDLMLGETVIAMGNPYGFNSSVTTGVISNVRRIVGDEAGFSIFIQTDAMINPGNSGGPLINVDGQVIGINTAIYKEAQGIGFSIPIDIVTRSVPYFIKYGKIIRGYPGFTVQEKQMANGVSLEVTEIMRGSAAEKMGIKLGDKIISLDNIPVNTIGAFNFISRTFPAGERVKVIIERNGNQGPAELLMEQMPANYGLSILNARYGITFKEYQNIIRVETSQNNYVQKGDIIVGVNNIKTTSSKQLAELLNNSDGGIIVLTLVRNNRGYSVQLRL